MAGKISSRIVHRLRTYFRRSSSAFTIGSNNTITYLQPSTFVTSSDYRTPASPHDCTDTLLLLSIMAYAGPTSLIIEDVPLDPITSLGDIERHFTGAEGYIGAKISNTRLNSTARIVQNFVFEFSSAADAAQAFQSRRIITVADRAYTVIPNGGFFDAERHVEDNVQPNQDQPNAGNVKKEPTDALKCRICMTEFQDSARVVPCLQCKAPRCHDCLKADFKAAMEDMDRMPLRCCEKVIHFDTARGILSPADLEAYKSRFDELNTINPLYCPVPKCSKFLSPRTFDGKSSEVTCPACDTRVCTNCKQIANEGHSCSGDFGRELILGIFSYKTCPKCGMGVAKMFGCPHIRCRCGAHWCWDCQRPLYACYERPCRTARENGNGPQDDSEVEADTNLDDDDEPEPEGPNVSRDQEANEAITDGAHTHRDFDSVHNGLEQSSEPADNPGFAALLIAIDIRDVQSDTAKEESGEQGGAQDIAAHVACGDGGPTTVPGGGPSASDGIHHTVVVVGPNGGGRGNNTIMANEALQPQTQATAGTSNTQEPASSDAISPSLPEFDDNATPDLDDPDLEDWEEDFDLGNEPRDEQWDVWGCRHRFQTFSTAGIPDFWLVGVDARKDDRVEIECMSCFKKVAVLKDDCGSKSDGSSSPPETQDQPGVVVQVKKSGTWKCKLCGVIYCKRCVKVAKKRIMRERISADQ